VSGSITVVLPRVGEVDLDLLGAAGGLLYFIEPRSRLVYTYQLDSARFTLQGAHNEVIRALPPELRPQR
jgi:hypothetical protein